MFDHLITVGLSGTARTIATEALSANYMGSGSLYVYATPAMIALMEAAAVNAIDSLLGAERTSVGIEIAVKHLSATPIGESVVAQATVTAVEGKRVTFHVQAWDDRELIGEGTHVRYIVDTERFMARVQMRE